MDKKRRVKVVTHTGSDISLEEAKNLGIEMIPDKVIFGNEEYRNLTEITVEDFYNKLKESQHLPQSSQPSMGDYLKAFRNAAKDGDEVLCLMITSKMSGCYKAALSASQMAQRQGINCPIHVFDTMQCSHGMAQMVRMAVSMADEGMSAEKIMDSLTKLEDRIGVYFVLDSLENAKKGGRVGAVTANTVNMLGLKPLLKFSDGLVREHGIAMNSSAGINKIADRALKRGNVKYPITVFHADAPQLADELVKKIMEAMPQADIRIGTVGPVIGIYTGSGCVGISYIEREDI